jgi:hypothetical protein
MNYFNLEEISVTPNNTHGWEVREELIPAVLSTIYV